MASAKRTSLFILRPVPALLAVLASGCATGAVDTEGEVPEAMYQPSLECLLVRATERVEGTVVETLDEWTYSRRVADLLLGEPERVLAVHRKAFGLDRAVQVESWFDAPFVKDFDVNVTMGSSWIGRIHLGRIRTGYELRMSFVPAPNDHRFLAAAATVTSARQPFADFRLMPRDDERPIGFQVPEVLESRWSAERMYWDPATPAFVVRGLTSWPVTASASEQPESVEIWCILRNHEPREGRPFTSDPPMWVWDR